MQHAPAHKNEMSRVPGRGRVGGAVRATGTATGTQMSVICGGCNIAMVMCAAAKNHKVVNQGAMSLNMCWGEARRLNR